MVDRYKWMVMGNIKVKVNGINRQWTSGWFLVLRFRYIFFHEEKNLILISCNIILVRVSVQCSIPDLSQSESRRLELQILKKILRTEFWEEILDKF